MIVTEKMIDIVAQEWELQYNNYEAVNLSPSNCSGLTQAEIDATTEWLYKNN